MTNPTHANRGHANHERKLWHRLRHDCTCADHCPSPDCYPAEDGRIGTDGGAAPHQRRAKLILPFDGRARIDHVGEHARRAAEDFFFECHFFIEADVVLHLRASADAHALADVDVLAKLHARADYGLFTHVAEVPNLGALAQRARLIHDGGRVDECGRIAHVGRAALIAAAQFL
jgi:hypothetical protein